MKDHGKPGAMMKVIPTIIATCLLALTLTACGGNSSQSNSTPTATPTSSTSSTSTSTSSSATSSARDQQTMASTFSIGYAGVGSDGNYYYLASDANVSFAAFVILSGDGTQSMNAVGQVSASGDYLTINDTTSGYSITFSVASADGGIVLTLADGTKVTMGSVDPVDVENMIIAIDQNTQIVNPLA